MTQRQRTEALQRRHTKLAAGDTTDDFTPIRLIQRCPKDVPACVEMTISASDMDSVLQRQFPEEVGPDILSDTLSTEFVVLSSGRLVGGPLATYEFSLTGYTGGMWCTSFGQSRVAVVGVLESGQTKVLTDAGEFLMEPDGLSVGCIDCVVPSNGLSFRRAPSSNWLEVRQLFQTEDGTVGIEQPKGCILMSEDFEYVSSEECEKLKSSTPLEVEFIECT